MLSRCFLGTDYLLSFLFSDWNEIILKEALTLWFSLKKLTDICFLLLFWYYCVHIACSNLSCSFWLRYQLHIRYQNNKQCLPRVILALHWYIVWAHRFSRQVIQLAHFQRQKEKLPRECESWSHGRSRLNNEELHYSWSRLISPTRSSISRQIVLEL